MAFPRYPSSRISDVQLPIMLIPDDDVDEDQMDSEPEPEVNPHRRQEAPQRPAQGSAPQHPIASMQDAFEESLVEATQGENSGKPKLRTGDAKARREELLDGAHSDPHPAARWRFRPDQQAHELRRLMAQISFGVYLLLNGMANSQILVVSILQGHIDEVDEFLETTSEDMDLATKDLRERIEHLKLPMENIQVFEKMLENREFRMQILEGNEKIEHILARTQVALRQTMLDLAEGLTATREFTIYLAEQHHGPWRQERPDVIDIFDAMKGNTDGWFNTLMNLQHKGSELNALVVRLAGVVSEMDRRAGEVSRRIRFSIEPYTSPKHSPRPSDASASSVTTPPTSPPRKIPNSPPRLSLRLSTINAITASRPSSYFNFSIAEDAEPSSENRPMTPRDTPVQENKEKCTDGLGIIPASPPQSPPREEFQQPQQSSPQSPPARNPRRLSERPTMLLDAPKLEISAEEESDAEQDEESTLYLLQPKVYTPQPSPRPSPRPSPQPSPRIPNERLRTRAEPSKPRAEPTRPRVQQSVPELQATPKTRHESPKPEVEQYILPGTTYKPSVAEVPRPKIVEVPRPKVVEIGVRTGAKQAPKRTPRPDPRPDPRLDPRPDSFRADSFGRDSFRTDSTRTESLRQESLRQESIRPESIRDPAQAPELVPEPDLEVNLYPQHRTSLRERVSLKTNPPESIQVPPPHALAHPSIRAYQTYQTYQAPDSAYGSDMERPPVNSMASINSSLADFQPPQFIQPNLIPSPHSDRQFFRPVQANPYSPLQQRPHTSGTVGHHFLPPPRNIPSAMGMSMMSNGTTATNETGSGKTLKKKRSAFGWLKKAFSLDEDERAAFEQKRQQQMENPYYGGRSPQFLDGKRIQPRPGY